MLITITYPVTSSYQLQVERDELPENPQDLLSSITRDEVLNGSTSGAGYDDLKDTMRQATVEDVEFLDEEDQELYVTV